MGVALHGEKNKLQPISEAGTLLILAEFCFESRENISLRKAFCTDCLRLFGMKTALIDPWIVALWCHLGVCVVEVIQFTLFMFLNLAALYWNAETGENDCLQGKGHTNQVNKMVLNEADELVSCSMDDTVRFTNLLTKEYRYEGRTV